MQPADEPRDDTRHRLLEAAGEVFAEKGLKGATVREICARAGVNIAAVNYYFHDKERLYIEAVKLSACCVTGKRPSWPAGTPPARKLRDFIHLLVGRLLDPTRPEWHSRLMMRELAQPTAACAELVRDYIQPMSEVLQGVLAELLPPDAPRQQRFLTGFSIVGQCLYYCQNRPIARLLMGDAAFDRLEPADVAEHVTRFSLAALGLAPTSRASNRTRGGPPRRRPRRKGPGASEGGTCTGSPSRC
jgi:AcrR family transcriptional regulator